MISEAELPLFCCVSLAGVVGEILKYIDICLKKRILFAQFKKKYYLCPQICAGREVSLCNRVDLDILNSVYWRFVFCGSKLRNFLIPNKNQSNSRCLWV